MTSRVTPETMANVKAVARRVNANARRKPSSEREKSARKVAFAARETR